jgi:serine/threonine protein kinase
LPQKSDRKHPPCNGQVAIVSKKFWEARQRQNLEDVSSELLGQEHLTDSGWQPDGTGGAERHGVWRVGDLVIKAFVGMPASGTEEDARPRREQFGKEVNVLRILADSHGKRPEATEHLSLALWTHTSRLCTVICMPYYHGGDLMDYMVRTAETRTRPAPEASRRLLQQLMSAVTHLHDLGLVHRDIKPENVMLAPKKAAAGTSSGEARDFHAYRVKLADFDMCQRADGELVTWTAGTLGYLDPLAMLANLDEAALLSELRCSAAELLRELDFWALSHTVWAFAALRLAVDPRRAGTLLQQLDGRANYVSCRPHVGEYYQDLVQAISSAYGEERQASAMEMGCIECWKTRLQVQHRALSPADRLIGPRLRMLALGSDQHKAP